MVDDGFHVDGIVYEVKNQLEAGCDGCSFYHNKTCTEFTAPCCCWEREDKRNVIFVEKQP